LLLASPGAGDGLKATIQLPAFLLALLPDLPLHAIMLPCFFPAFLPNLPLQTIMLPCLFPAFLPNLPLQAVQICNSWSRQGKRRCYQ
jgi:hypothetical protein